jgi:small subunit ribosomal protein S8
MIIDPIADMLTRIRNANQALLPDVEIQHSKMKECIAQILKREGYLADFQVRGESPKRLQVKLKFQGRKGVIDKLERVSRPGLRRYVHATEIPRILGGMGTVIMSTPRGMMTGTDARKQNLGGEIICYIC